MNEPVLSVRNGDPRYDSSNSAYRWMVNVRMDEVANLFSEKKWHLRELNVLDIGCGEGKIMNDFLARGAAGDKLTGIDLDFNRLQNARRASPAMRWANADASRLPFPERSFDVVMQWTVFSSISGRETRQKAAMEMKRVLKPGGMILWYDFWINPFNPRVCPMTRSDVEDLFSGWRLEFKRVTLAPPLARLLYPLVPQLCRVLEKQRWLNTHYLVQMEPPLEESRRYG